MHVKELEKKGAIRLSLEVIIMMGIGIALAIGLFFLIWKGVQGPSKNILSFAESVNINFSQLW